MFNSITHFYSTIFCYLYRIPTPHKIFLISWPFSNFFPKVPLVVWLFSNHFVKKKMTCGIISSLSMYGYFKGICVLSTSSVEIKNNQQIIIASVVKNLFNRENLIWKLLTHLQSILRTPSFPIFQFQATKILFFLMQIFKKGL